MPFIIRNVELERRLEEQAAHSPVPTTKGPLTRSMLAALLDHAERRGLTVFEVMRELREQQATKRKASSPRVGAATS